MATVRRKDITLEEETDIHRLFDGGVRILSAWWEARLDGRSTTGETVQMSRTASHAGEALALLEEALEKEGWTLR